MPVKNAVNTKQQLELYFGGDLQERFAFAGMHSEGTTALTWKVTYRPVYKAPQRAYGPPRHLVLKTQKTMDEIGVNRALLFNLPGQSRATARREGFVPNEKRWLKVSVQLTIYREAGGLAKDEANRIAEVRMG